MESKCCLHGMTMTATTGKDSAAFGSRSSSLKLAALGVEYRIRYLMDPDRFSGGYALGTNESGRCEAPEKSAD